MKKLVLYIVKRFLTSKPLIGWGILLTFFWIFVGAYLESSSLNSVPTSIFKEAYYTYTTNWFMFAIIYSLSALATTVSNTITYQTGSLPFLFKFGKLTPRKYLASVYVGVEIVSLVIGLLMTAFTTILFSTNGKGVFVYPANIPITILAILLAGFFMTSLAFLLDIVVIKYLGLKNQNFVSFIPLILVFIFYFLYIYSTFKSAIPDYLSPFNALMLIAGIGFYGKALPVSMGQFTAGMETSVPSVSLTYLVASALIWGIVLSVIDTVLIKKITLRNINEGKIF
ncbi:hypothetical protein [Acidianus sp. RZ1]|uniref:hypothetical protein n=1 Tax=Acidianus sp. RZ1 TaxID=1540082 RepID=UPI001492B388|nr:hypothetical protein [Acidianus sp. RZ1]NON61471.1 hypothetical protein [Acidianus sp. RZ1]